LKKLLYSLSNVKFYQEYFTQNNINTDFLPIGSLSKDSLMEAKMILFEIHDTIEEIEKERKKYMKCDIQKLLKL